MPSIDTQDPKYQVTDQFKPDKESTWKYPAERDGWRIAHNAIRGELAFMRETLQIIRGRALQQWEVQALKEAANAHLLHIRSHHKNEDVFIVPEFQKRFVYPKNLEIDHEKLTEMLKVIENKIEVLDVGGTVDDLLETWIEYETMMLPHLQQEEEIGIPLMRAYFTKKDLDPMVEKLIANSPSVELGSIIYFETPERFRSDLMKNEEIPWFVWYIAFRSKYNLFKRTFVANLEAIKLGQAPKAGFFAALRAWICSFFWPRASKLKPS